MRNNTFIKARGIVIFLVCLSFTLLSCNTNNNNKQSVSGNEKAPTVTTSNPYADLGGLPFEKIKELHSSCDQIDYMFNELPISMALSEESAVKNNIAFISPDKVQDIPGACKPLGRQLFYSRGELKAEADLFFSEECHFLVFLENDKPIYINGLTQAGINFYSNIMAQVGNAQSSQ